MSSPRIPAGPSPGGHEPPGFAAAYDRLRALAASYVQRMHPSGTLQATALVHEAYLKLAKETRQFNDGSHLVYATAMAMRQVLLDHARARHRQKRGGEMIRVTLTGEELGRQPGVDVMVLDDALQRLHTLDERQAQTVELRFFVGLSVEETARVLEVSEKTVKRDWAMARAWLQRELHA